MNSSPMSVLQVNHGYPDRYNAGSEVYTRNLSHALVGAGHPVSVFAREEDPYRPDYDLRIEHDGAIPVHLINMPRSQHRWQHDEVDAAFARVLAATRPGAVHFHHLNHLSLGLPGVAARAGCAVVFTAHDFWLACPRGQFVQWSLGGEPWALCPGQEDSRCAEACYARCHSGETSRQPHELMHWRNWVGARMEAVERQLRFVDVLLCPSRTVASALRERFPWLVSRIRLMDYGFPARAARPREQRTAPVLGYIGTHAAPKGVDLLIRAFRRVQGGVQLRILGRPRGQETESLRRLAAGDARIAFEGEYCNGDVTQILAGLDAIVVPSLWFENSPLVIHEAQQCRVCVVTADAGGMAEFVAHEVNGLLFRHRDERSLTEQLQRVADCPALAERLGARGYLHSPTGEVLSIDDQARELAAIYGEPREERALEA